MICCCGAVVIVSLLTAGGGGFRFLSLRRSVTLWHTAAVHGWPSCTLLSKTPSTSTWSWTSTQGAIFYHSCHGTECTIINAYPFVREGTLFLSLSLFMCLSGSLFFLLFIFCCIYYIIICSIICFKIKYFVAGGRGGGNQKHIIYKCTVNSNCIDKDGEISLLGVTF